MVDLVLLVLKKPNMKKYTKDTKAELERSPLVQMSRDLLINLVDSTSMLEKKDMNESGLKEAKVVLGYLNAANNTMKTRMQYYRMTDLPNKIRAVKKRAIV